MDERNRRRDAAGGCKRRAVNEGTIVAIVQAPAGNMLRPARALEHGGKFWTDFPGVPISELMENSPVLVENAMISVDQFKELVALEPVIEVALVGTRELLCKP